jgi:iron complex transport system ATP-binding protein
LLSARDLTFAYPARGFRAAPAPVVRGVSLDVSPGDRLGILGPNGSGKTTLLKLLGGLLAPDAGRVTLDGRPLASIGRGAVARRIAVVPQDTHPAFDYTALELVLMGRYPHLSPFEVEGPDDYAIALDAMEATGTAAFAQRPFLSLSGGERQRVVVAAALAQQADLLLLDEPTTSLDPGYQLEIVELLRRLHGERGVALVVSTHDLNFAAAICDRLALLRDGRLVASGATRDVLTPESVNRLYGIDADVRFHDRAGHLTVVPVARR